MSHEATNWAFKVRGISPTECRVLLNLADCHNPVYGCFPKQDYLAEASEIDERSVRRCLISLRAKGLVNWVEQREKDRRKANRYSLAFEAGFRPHDPENPDDSAKSEPDNMSGSPEAPTGQDRQVEPDSGGHLNRTPESAIEPVREPVREQVREREDARERETGEGQDAGGDERHDDPKALLKRVKAMEIGRAGNPWPGAIGSSTTWALQQFEKLPEDMRRLAEDNRDPYLAICKAQGVKPVALGLYFRDHKFLDVTREAAKAAVAKVERVAVKPFGPVWGGMRAYALGRGPEHVEMPGDIRGEAEKTYQGLLRNPAMAQRFLERKGIALNAAGQLVFPDDFERAELRRRQCSDGYPLVNHLHTLAAERGAELVDGRNQHLAELCEAVPVGGAVYEAWRALHAERNWPAWPEPGGMRVIYFPKGGPEGMAQFMEAARAAMAEGGRDAHAA